MSVAANEQSWWEDLCTGATNPSCCTSGDNTFDLGPNGELTISSLQAGNDYTCTVRACNEHGCGANSSGVTQTTSDQLPDPVSKTSQVCPHHLELLSGGRRRQGQLHVREQVQPRIATKPFSTEMQRP